MADVSILPAEWQPGIDAIRSLPDGGLCLLVGATDRGKTTFVLHASRLLSQEFSRVALIDADVGQSEIGPPGTVGVAGIRREWANDLTTRLTDLKATSLYFAGAFTPAPIALELVTAVGQAARFTREARAQRILVDSCGYVIGPAARRFNVIQAQILAPSIIVAIQRDEEIASLVQAMRHATGASVVSLPVPAAVGRKSPNLRATRRMTRLAKALEGSIELSLSLQNISLVGSILGGGMSRTPELVRWIGDTLRLPVIRAEQSEGVLTLFTRGRFRPVPDAATAPIAAHFKVSSVRLLPIENYQDVYVGLHDGSGRLLSVGRFLELDAERDEITVATPPPATVERVHLVTFGRVRVPSDASGHTELRPGDI